MGAAEDSDHVGPFDEYTDEELRDELKRRAEYRDLVAKDQRTQFRTLVIKHKDVLLALIDHDRVSCQNCDNSDYTESGVAECNRCALKNLEPWQDVEVSIDVRLTTHDGRGLKYAS
jgi:hypothetical protein